MRGEKEIKEKLELFNQSGSKSKTEERILFAKIDLLEWILNKKADVDANEIIEQLLWHFEYEGQTEAQNKIIDQAKSFLNKYKN